MKRILFIVLLAVVVEGVLAQRFNYVYKGVNFRCKVEKEGACVTSFDYGVADVVVPARVEHKGKSFPVKRISTFKSGMNYSTISLTMEEGIEDIDRYAFNEFRQLVSVKLPASVRHIGRYAFRNNFELVLTMPAGVDEKALREGKELWPSGEGGMVVASANRAFLKAERDRKAKEEAANELAAKKLKKEAKQKAILAQREAMLAQREARAAAKAVPAPNFWAEKAAKARQNRVAQTQPQPQPKPQVRSQAEGTAVASNGAWALKKPEELPVDVDMNIPVVVSDKNRDTYCVIIANENYEDVPKVDYALRDGKVFKEYCVKTFGIPEKQIRMFSDASYTDIKRALNWMETMANVTEGRGKIVFYYAGHGMPDEKDKAAYLIPTDGFPKDVTTCFKLSELYGRLAKMPAQNITVLLDACFSGVKRGSGQALVAARGVAIKPKNEVLGGNMVVFTAASGDETALSYQEKRHGMFTYFLLDQLKKTRGKVNFGDLFRNLSFEVKKNSMLENDKLQTPSVHVSDRLRGKWEKLQF